MGLSFKIADDLASAVILRFESRGIHGHILLSHIRGSPNLEGQVPVFVSPRNRVAQLYPQALCSLFVASYDYQSYGGNIRARLHTGLYQPAQLALGPFSSASSRTQQKTPFPNNSSTVIEACLPLHRNGSSSVVVCVFISAETWLPSRYLTMNYSGFQTSCHNRHNYSNQALDTHFKFGLWSGLSASLHNLEISWKKSWDSSVSFYTTGLHVINRLDFTNVANLQKF
jgi:hypothetical protein